MFCSSDNYLLELSLLCDGSEKFEEILPAERCLLLGRQLESSSDPG